MVCHHGQSLGAGIKCLIGVCEVELSASVAKVGGVDIRFENVDTSESLSDLWRTGQHTRSGGLDNLHMQRGFGAHQQLHGVG